MSKNDVLIWCHCECAIVFIEVGNISSDGNVWITFHGKITVEEDELEHQQTVGLPMQTAADYCSACSACSACREGILAVQCVCSLL